MWNENNLSSSLSTPLNDGVRSNGNLDKFAHVCLRKIDLRLGIQRNGKTTPVLGPEVCSRQPNIYLGWDLFIRSYVHGVLTHLPDCRFKDNYIITWSNSFIASFLRGFRDEGLDSSSTGWDMTLLREGM